ncbi:MAG: S9 family peptidase [Anaerolineae bacterium]|nr:S9 family peptidase [Anaerolineae bacterium]
MTPYPISRYLNVQSAYAPAFAADGDTLVFLSNLTGIPQVWRVPFRFGQDYMPWPEQLTFEADRVMGARPSPNAGRILYARDVGGNENAQLFLLDPDTGEERNLSAGYEAAMHVPGEWSADGSAFLFSANRRHPGLFDLYVQPLDGEARLAWQNEAPGYLMPVVWSPDGRRVAVIRNESGAASPLFEVELESGQVRQLSPADQAVRHEGVQYSSDGRALYVTTDLGRDFIYIARVDLDTGTYEPVVALDWDVEHLVLAPDGRTLAYAVNEDGAATLHALDLLSGETRTALLPGDAPGVVAWMDWRLAFSPDSRYLAFSFTSATRTSDVFVWDLAGEQVQQATYSSHGGLPTAAFTAPELIHYPTFDAVDGQPRLIPAWFYRPIQTGDGPLPVVINVHGGPESQFRPFFHFFVQYFLQQGYAVLAPNVRGSTGYGRAYSHLDDVEKRMDSVADLAYAAHWLKAQPGIDGERLVVSGGSYGGFMVLAALTAYPDLWAAGVDIVGISSFVTFLENTSAYRRAHREAEYGSLAQDREFMERIAPINHVDQITAPLMVIHGANDPRVPVGEAEQLVAALRERGVPVELLVFGDEGHGLVKLANKLVAYPAIVDFLEKHLGADTPT